MGSGFNLGRILGIQIRLHYTWFLIFFLVAGSLVFFLPADYPLWLRIISGVVGSLLFFASIVAHELAHSVVAIRYGIPVKSITLFIFGGVAQLTREVTQARAELLIALVGPLSSLTIAGIFAGVGFVLRGLAPPPIIEMLGWLAWINVLLALFNLIPGLPLDGGRVLRAVIWRITGSYKRATRIAALTGRGFAYLFIVGGILMMFITRSFNGLWLVFIGWFLASAAGASYKQAQLQEAAQGFTARDVMTQECPIVSRHLTINQLVQDYVLYGGRHCFMVADEGRLEGIITLHDIKTTPQQQRDMITVGEIMTPASKLAVVSPHQDVPSLLEQMDERNINQLPVVEEGRIIGIVTRDSLTRFIQTRSEIGG